jgi:hypothetical protein
MEFRFSLLSLQPQRAALGAQVLVSAYAGTQGGLSGHVCDECGVGGRRPEGDFGLRWPMV